MTEPKGRPKFVYNAPPGVEAGVPGTQELRVADNEEGVIGRDVETGIIIKEEEPTFTPVITITKEEFSYAKGPHIDMKLQKIVVTEDIAMNYFAGEKCDHSSAVV